MSVALATPASLTARPRRRGTPTMLPLAQWPEVDRNAWRQACEPADLLDEAAGLASGWRPASKEVVQRAYGSWLAYLQGRDLLAGPEDPADRLTPEQVRGFARAMQERGDAPLTISSRLGHLVMMAKTLFPRRNWSWLRAIRARRQQFAKPTRNKAARIVDIGQLEQLGLDLMAEAADMERDDPEAAACLHRDGLIIALLARYPIRRKNLLELEIGQHLVRTSVGCRIDNPITKNHRPLSNDFPPPLRPYLEIYLSRHRPRLLTMRRLKKGALAKPTATQHLWINRFGGPMAAGSFRTALARHSTKRFGWAVTPHDFRHCAATSIGEHDPDNVRLAASVLGHANFRTTERHYIVAKGNEAQRGYHDIILSRRKLAGRNQRWDRKE